MKNIILETTRFVVEHVDVVKINQEQLLLFAQDFNHGNIQHWLSQAPFDFSLLTEDEKLHFIFLLNTLSFCYWGEPKWTLSYNENQYDGAWAMIIALRRALEEGQPLLDFSYCEQIGRDEFAHIFRGNVEIPLLNERWNMLRELGKIMTRRFSGKARALVSLAGHDAQKLLRVIIQEIPSYLDFSPYKGRDIYFNKRAQLLVGDIFQLFGGKGFGALNGVDQLTACADYKIPRLLRKLGILEYSPPLATQIDELQELIHNSPAEVEIRASTIWAVELLTREIKKRIPHVFAFQVNDHLWLATQEKFPDDKPYHRTRTVAY